MSAVSMARPRIQIGGTGAAGPERRQLAALRFGEESGGVVGQIGGEEHAGDPEEEEQDLRQDDVGPGRAEPVGNVVDDRGLAGRDPLDGPPEGLGTHERGRRVERGIGRAVGPHVQLDDRRRPQRRGRRGGIGAQRRNDDAGERCLIDDHHVRDRRELRPECPVTGWRRADRRRPGRRCR